MHGSLINDLDWVTLSQQLEREPIANDTVEVGWHVHKLRAWDLITTHYGSSLPDRCSSEASRWIRSDRSQDINVTMEITLKLTRKLEYMKHTASQFLV